MSKVKVGDVLMVTVGGFEEGPGGNAHQFPVNSLVVVSDVDNRDTFGPYGCQGKDLYKHNSVKIGTL